MAMRYVGTLLKNMVLCLGVGFTIFEPAGTAHAQLFFSRIPPGDIVNIVRNRGFYDVENPYFRGDVYVVDASERRGLRVRLVVDPRTGDIVERLIVGRNNRVYPAGPNVVTVPPLGVERQVFDRPAIDNERKSRSTIELDEDRPRVRQVRPVKKRVKQEPFIDPVAPSAAQPLAAPNSQIIDTRPQAPSSVIIEAPKDKPVDSVPMKSQIQPPSAEPSKALNPFPATAPSVKSADPAPTTPVQPNSGQTQRGTRENPRKVGPILPPPIGVE